MRKPPVPLDPCDVRRVWDYVDGYLVWRDVLPPGKRHLVGTRVACTARNGYTVTAYNYKQYKAHRLVWAWHHGAWPEHDIDHINGVRSDNRIENLRDAEPQVNHQNLHRAHRDSSTGVLGVHRTPNNTFMALAVDPGTRKRVYLGAHKSAAEASEIRAEYVRANYVGNDVYMRG